MQESPSPSTPASPDPFRTRLLTPSPWLFILGVGGLYLFGSALVESLQLPLGLLWSQAFLFAWPSLLWLRRAGYRPLTYLRADRLPRAPWLTLGIAGGAFLCGSALMGLFQTLAPESLTHAFDVSQILSSVNGGWSAVLYFGVIVGAPVAEETVFRGCLLPMLAERMGVWRALVLQAVLFSLIHGDPVGFLPRIVLGLAFGALWLWTGSLWAGVFAHALNNGISSAIYLWFGGDSGGDIGSGELAASAAIALGAGALLVGLIYRLRATAPKVVLPSNDAAALGLPVAEGFLAAREMRDDFRRYFAAAIEGFAVVAAAAYLQR